MNNLWGILAMVSILGINTGSIPTIIHSYRIKKVTIEWSTLLILSLALLLLEVATIGGYPDTPFYYHIGNVLGCSLWTTLCVMKFVYRKNCSNN